MFDRIENGREIVNVFYRSLHEYRLIVRRCRNIDRAKMRHQKESL